MWSIPPGILFAGIANWIMISNCGGIGILDENRQNIRKYRECGGELSVIFWLARIDSTRTRVVLLVGSLSDDAPLHLSAYKIQSIDSDFRLLLH